MNAGFITTARRYYAPWLQRWVSADPAGEVDGLNLYGFVRNNPLRYVDNDGEASGEAVIRNYSNFISVLVAYATQTLEQIDNIINKTNIAKDLAKNLAGESINAAIGFAGGYYGAGEVGIVLPDKPHIAFLTKQSKPPFSEGLTGGNLGGELAGSAGGAILPTSGLIRPLIPQTSTMSIKEIDRQVGVHVADDSHDWLGTGISIALNNVVGSVVPGVGAILAMGSRVQEAEDINNRLDPVKILKIERMLDEWESVDNERFAQFEKAFDAAGVDTLYPQRTTLNVSGSAPEAIHRIDVQRAHHKTQDLIRRSKAGMARYREMGTTDNQFLARQARTASRHHAPA
ncbi:insecticidal toxin complex protein TccC [Pseudomonas silensiensis]|nr:insecticidal toxin complex protein TccC [Pseudomonas silensiensis]